MDPRYSSIHGEDAKAAEPPSLPEQIRAAAEAATDMARADEERAGDYHTRLLQGGTPRDLARFALGIIEAHERADRLTRAREYLRNLAESIGYEAAESPACEPTRGGGMLPTPGTMYGACPEPCDHTLCARHRAIADAHCVLCEEPIGYGRAYVVQTVDHDDGEADIENGPHPGDGPVTMLAHRSCVDDSAEAERKMSEEGSSVEF